VRATPFGVEQRATLGLKQAGARGAVFVVAQAASERGFAPSGAPGRGVGRRAEVFPSGRVLVDQRRGGTQRGLGP
jgi:hypothetical protein